MQNYQSFVQVAQFVADMYEGRRVVLRPYAYPIAVAAVVPGTSASYTQKINGNSDFVLVDLLYTQNPPSDVLLQITDTASQENLFNSPADMLNVIQAVASYGDVSLGMFKRLAANSNQLITFANDNGAAQNLAAGYFLLRGVNVFVL